VIPCQKITCPRQDSNLRHRLRRAVLYPLSYGGPATTELYQASPYGPADQPRRETSYACSGNAPIAFSLVANTSISASWFAFMVWARLVTSESWLS
jgi:hypothetical protein